MQCWKSSLVVTERVGPKTRGSSSAPDLWIIIEPLAPGPRNRQGPIQKDTYLHWKQAPSKSSKLHCKTTHANRPAKQEHTQENQKTAFSVQLLTCVWLFATPWTAAHQASLSITNSQSLLNSWPLSQWCLPNISSSLMPLSSGPQSFPASGSFKVNQLFSSGGHSSGA